MAVALMKKEFQCSSCKMFPRHADTTGRQCTPSCSMCTAQKCQCIRLWRKELDNTVCHSVFPTDIRMPNLRTIGFKTNLTSINQIFFFLFNAVNDRQKS